MDSLTLAPLSASTRDVNYMCILYIFMYDIQADKPEADHRTVIFVNALALQRYRYSDMSARQSLI